MEMDKYADKYIQVYKVSGGDKFLKLYEYLGEFMDKRDFKAESVILSDFVVAVYASPVRHMRIEEYLDNLN